MYRGKKISLRSVDLFLFYQRLNIMARLTTIFLLLTLVIPVGALGSVSHRCGTDDSAQQKCCDHNKLSEQSASDASGSKTNRCTLSAVPDELPLATTDYKPRLDAPQSADVLSSFAGSLRSSEASIKILRPVLLHSPTSGPPLFIRLCSFLN